MSAELVLTSGESAALANDERIINRGLISFREAGAALMRIRDGKLYRADHDSFEAYCEKRWGLTRRRAYQLIESSETVASLPEKVCTMVHNERQVRELAKVPEEKRAAVLEAVADSGQKPTAKAIRDAARVIDVPTRETWEEPTPAPEPEPPREEERFHEEEPETARSNRPDPGLVVELCIAHLEQIRDDAERLDAVRKVRSWCDVYIQMEESR